MTFNKLLAPQGFKKMHAESDVTYQLLDPT